MILETKEIELETENGGLPVIFMLTCNVIFLFVERREGARDKGRGKGGRWR